MTSTTIKVSTPLRDRLRTAASRRQQTMGEHLEELLDEEDRRLRFVELRARMAACPPDEEYLREAEQWQGEAWN